MARYVKVPVPAGVDIRTLERAIERTLAELSAMRNIHKALEGVSKSPGPGALAQAALREERWREIEKEWGMLTGAEVATLFGHRPESARSTTSNLRRRKHLTGVKRHGALRYPAFQFAHLDAGPAVVAPAWITLCELLVPAQWSNPDILIWAGAPNAYLDGRSPAEEIRDHPEGVTDSLRHAVDQAIPKRSRPPTSG